jgi:very-short-patch-repair endonuclease
MSFILTFPNHLIETISCQFSQAIYTNMYIPYEKHPFPLTSNSPTHQSMRKAATKADSEATDARKRNMRHLPTRAEHKLWTLIKDKALGVKFLRQERIKLNRNDMGYFADYVCYECDLIIEIDTSLTLERAQNAQRNEYFAGGGFEVIRFRDKDISGNPNACVAKIAAAITAVGE